jgi:hypothetical protein
MRATPTEPNRTNNNAIAKRIPAIRQGNSMNESARAAGFNEGAASTNASDDAILRVVWYTAGNIGAAQQEHSMSGAPASAAANWSCAVTPSKILCSGVRDMLIRTAALSKMPKTSAGHTIFK